MDYDDDRPGMMRVHIAAVRSDLACQKHTRNHMRAVAYGKGLRGLGSQTKREIGWYMAQHGLIDDDGYLRDGFPEAAGEPS